MRCESLHNFKKAVLALPKVKDGLTRSRKCAAVNRFNIYSVIVVLEGCDRNNVFVLYRIIIRFVVVIAKLYYGGQVKSIDGTVQLTVINKILEQRLVKTVSL